MVEKKVRMNSGTESTQQSSQRFTLQSLLFIMSQQKSKNANKNTPKNKIDPIEKTPEKTNSLEINATQGTISTRLQCLS